MRPFEVETIAVPKPPRILGIFFALLYTRKPGLLARVIFVIRGVLSFPLYLRERRRELLNPFFNSSKDSMKPSARSTAAILRVTFVEGI